MCRGPGRSRVEVHRQPRDPGGRRGTGVRCMLLCVVIVEHYTPLYSVSQCVCSVLCCVCVCMYYSLACEHRMFPRLCAIIRRVNMWSSFPPVFQTPFFYPWLKVTRLPPKEELKHQNIHIRVRNGKIVESILFLCTLVV